jgi:hypothetical protein
MSDPKRPIVSDELNEKDLEGVAGGRMKIPGKGPQSQVPGSIAQGDTIDNNDNLPSAGGGVIVG